MPTSKKVYLRKYRLRMKTERASKGRVVRAFVSTEIRNNPYYSKFVIDTIIDARQKWIEQQKLKELDAQKCGIQYNMEPCPLTSEGLKWISEYLNFLYITKNGSSF